MTHLMPALDRTRVRFHLRAGRILRNRLLLGALFASLGLTYFFGDEGHVK